MAKYTDDVKGVSPLRRLFMSQRAIEQARRQELSLRIQRKAFEQYRELLGRGLETYSGYGTGWALTDGRIICYEDVDDDAGLVRRVRVLPNNSLKEQLREQGVWVVDKKYYLDDLALLVTQSLQFPLNDHARAEVWIKGDYFLDYVYNNTMDCRRVRVEESCSYGAGVHSRNLTVIDISGDIHHRVLSFERMGDTYAGINGVTDSLKLLTKLKDSQRVVGEVETTLPLARNLFRDIRDLYHRVEDSRAA